MRVGHLLEQEDGRGALAAASLGAAAVELQYQTPKAMMLVR